MSDKEDYLTSYRVFFENFAANVNPEDQLPVNIAGYTITEAELPGEVLYWTTQYLTEKSCPLTLMTPLRRIILEEVRIASKKQPTEFGYKSDEGVYIALRLMQAMTARVNAVCLRYLDNSRLDSLPPPPPPAQRDLTTVSCATKNSRRVMEDRHVEIGNLEALFGIETTEPTSFYAVYDGHAGSAAATYCAAHLHQYLAESPHFAGDLQAAMRDAFLRTDAEFVRKSNQQERACGGSTAVAVAVRSRRLLAAWAGDSLALLAKRMRLMQLVRPHKPGRQDERERIESSGGTVMFWGTWRVNGQLAVSRAIGDAQYKPYVTARPEIATVELDGDEDFVVVACDGLWDFVSEDDVALAVYRQIAADPDDLKAVTKRLVVQAKRQGSADNISIIVVFLKDPRLIAADNCPPMDLGLDNALANAPPFVMEAEACKRLDAVAAEAEAESGECEAEADNGVDHSDSDSEDLGPETAVDVDADDLDADARNHVPAAPTPPAHAAVEASHIDGALADNVGESGEESEDEWNYFKGEGEAQRDEPDEPPRSETPCQDNSAWESSSVDMNSSPLNPDAPVFVPTGVAGADVLLAESPRKPLPMDDIELPDSAQFNTEAVVRPAELLDLDNCDQLNGHHNVSIEGVKEHLNGNEKTNLDSLGFGFNVGIEPEKVTDTALIQDFQRIQKDTTDFCDIQVFHQSHPETNPFAADGNEELFERLKNKERDPMSMSFYQEKDDDTCERLGQPESRVDLNAVQPLPDSDDEDLQTNGVCDSNEKENISPQQNTDLLGDLAEPNNDVIRFDERTDILNNAPNFGQGDSFMDFSVSSNNMQNYSNMDFDSNNVPQEVAHTETPESHKLLFEQIPEIPDGKSSELGFTNEDNQDPSESEKDARVGTPQEETSQDVEMESKLEDSPCEDISELTPELKEDEIVPVHFSAPEQVASPEPVQLLDDKENEIISESALNAENQAISTEQLSASPAPAEQAQHKPAASPEAAHDIRENIVVDVHQGFEPHHEHDIDFDTERRSEMSDFNDQFGDNVPEKELDASELKFEPETIAPVAESPLPTASPLPPHSPAASEPTAPAASPAPPQAAESPASPLPAESPLPTQSPIPAEVPLPRESPPPEERYLTPYEYIAQTLPQCCLRPDLAVPPRVPHFNDPDPEEEAPAAPAPLQAEARLLPAEEPEAQAHEQAQAPEPSGPTPDIVPEEPPRSDLVTDIDIGIPESRAQEICVPVTSEIHQDDGVVASATPAPPAAQSPAPLSDTPIAGDIAPSDDTAVLAGVAAAAAAVAATAVAANAVKSKTTPAAKKTPTSKLAPKTGSAARTPTSVKKPASTTTTPAAKTPVPKTTPARTPSSAAKPAATPTSAARLAPRTTPAKPSAPPARPAARSAPAPAKPTSTPPRSTAAPARAATAAKTAPAAAKPAPIKEATAVAKSSTTTRTAPAARPTARAAPARPTTAPARPAAAARPAPRLAPARPAASAGTAAARPKAPEKKPLTNGDVKAPAAKPAPRPAPITRPAPRPTPRAPAAAPLTALPKSAAAAPKPAPRAARPLGRDADRPGKELAPKRIAAKTAPPRTAATKPSAGTKAPVPVPKKAKEIKKEESNGPTNGLTNGAAEAELALALGKPPVSPPAADGALLPDVIA